MVMEKIEYAKSMGHGSGAAAAGGAGGAPAWGQQQPAWGQQQMNPQMQQQQIMMQQQQVHTNAPPPPCPRAAGTAHEAVLCCSPCSNIYRRRWLSGTP